MTPSVSTAQTKTTMRHFMIPSVHTAPEWIQLNVELDILYIHLFSPISARLLSQIQAYQLSQGDPLCFFLRFYILNFHILEVTHYSRYSR